MSRSRATSDVHRLLHHVAIAVLIVSLCTAAAPSTRLRGVGFREFTVRDPLNSSSMSAVEFYPSTVANTLTPVGPYDIVATRNAPVAGGRFGVVVLSHGTGGSKWDLHDLAESLARAGYVTASLTHPGDNYRDHSGLGTDRVLIGRPKQMSALLDRVLNDPILRTHIDRRRIAVGGFSAGGYTALVMAGARPNFALLGRYCHQHTTDLTFCWNGNHTHVQISGLVAGRDHRVRAVIALAPVGLYFDRAGLATVKVRVLLFDVRRDEVLTPRNNADHVAESLPKPPFRYVVFPEGSHLVFVAPCTKRMRTLAPAVCADASGTNRALIHHEIERDTTNFLASVLDR